MEVATVNQQSTPCKKWVFVLFACLTLLNTMWIVIHVAIRTYAVMHSQSANGPSTVQPPSFPAQSQPVVPKVQPQPATNAAEPQSTDTPVSSQAVDDSNATYIAIISCGASGYTNLNALACFAGTPSTEIELTNGDNYGLYKPYQINSLGTSTERGLEIHLQHHFSIKAQNSSTNLILGLRVVNEKTGQQLFGKQVTQFGVIDVSN